MRQALRETYALLKKFLTESQEEFISSFDREKYIDTDDIYVKIHFLELCDLFQEIRSIKTRKDIIKLVLYCTLMESITKLHTKNHPSRAAFCSFFADYLGEETRKEFEKVIEDSERAPTVSGCAEYIYETYRNNFIHEGVASELATDAPLVEYKSIKRGKGSQKCVIVNLTISQTEQFVIEGLATFYQKHIKNGRLHKQPT